MTVDDYINQQTSDQQRILRWLRPLILNSATGIREKISWNVPCYSFRGRLLCYQNVLRNEVCAVDLSFWDGLNLPDEAGLLQDRGRKLVRSLVIRNPADWDEDVIRTYIQEALLINEKRSL